MSAIEQAFREAAENDDGPFGKYFYSQPTGEIILYDMKCQIFLEPAFWKALGISRGWKTAKRIKDREWFLNWHRFIDHLAQGNDPESFFQELLAPHK